MVVPADKGLADKAIERYAAEQTGVLLARPDRDLAQLAHQRRRQTLPDRVRPLKPEGITRLVSRAGNPLKI